MALQRRQPETTVKLWIASARVMLALSGCAVLPWQPAATSYSDPFAEYDASEPSVELVESAPDTFDSAR